MSSTLLLAAERLLLLEPYDEVPASAELMPLVDGAAAQSFACRLFAEPLNRDVLAAVLSNLDPLGISLRNERAQIRATAALLSSGELRVARYGMEQRGGGISASGTEAVGQQPAPATKEDHFIEFRVVDDKTGKPCNDVKLAITLPDESEHERTTGADGVIDFPSVTPGSAKVASEIPDAGWQQTLDFVGTGEPPTPDDESQEDDEAPPGPYQIRQVDAHQVRSGETLESVATSAGMSWQDLAKFNWGTSAPAEINKHLRFEVGCTNKDRAGDNYVFDDDDQPGIVSVPRPFARAGLGIDQVHALRVRQLERLLAIRLDDPFLGFLGETSVEARYADGSTDTFETDPHGVVEVEVDRWSKDGNFVDLTFETDLREHGLRVFIVLEHASSRNGAWQRLVNLGYVPIDEPKAEPEHEALFCAALEEFQADHGIPPNGELDGPTRTALDQWHVDARSWGEHGRVSIDDPDDSDTRSKEEVA
ncbi:MAG: LysM peptidoglycan-binding domain-containing protein [Deltaproteobacteria bacterium]|nr:LysM peptidoglycan-binding domain-containing protein [Deltaproteobacteria bacterium]